MKTQIEIAHALRKAAEWERDPARDGERCKWHSARRVADERGFMGACSPLAADAVQFCATGRLSRELGFDCIEAEVLWGFKEEMDRIEALHDKQAYADAADLLDGLALLVEETIPVTVHG